MTPLAPALLTALAVAGAAGAVSSMLDADRRLRVLARIRRLDGHESPSTVPAPVRTVVGRIAPDLAAETAWRHGRIVITVLLGVAVLRAPLPTLIVVAIATLVTSRLTRRRRVEPRGPADDAEQLASRLASGADPRAAIALLAADDGPAGAPVRRAIDAGAPLQECVDRWASVEGGADRILLADAWAVAGTTGAGIAPALLRAGDTLRERRALELEITALTAQARLSARVLTIVPVGFAIFVALLDDRVAAFLLTTAAGHVSIVIGLLLAWCGSRWMRHLVEAAR